MQTQTPDSLSSPVRVLLVEDSTVLAERLADVIRETLDARLLGITDTEADALAVIQQRPVDVVVLDLHLREGTGFGVLRALATWKRMPRVIVLTNYDLPEYKATALALGASYFLDKARDYVRLPQLLQEMFHASNPVHSQH